MLVNKLEKIKEEYDVDLDFDKAIQAVISVFDELNTVRIDVANCIFDYDAKFETAFLNIKWNNQITKYYNSILEDEKNINCFDMLYSTISMKGENQSNRSHSFVKIVKNIFDKKTFDLLENAAFKFTRELMIKSLEPVDYMSQEELIKHYITFYEIESKGSYYEDKVKELILSVTNEIKLKL